MCKNCDKGMFPGEAAKAEEKRKKGGIDIFLEAIKSEKKEPGDKILKKLEKEIDKMFDDLGFTKVEKGADKENRMPSELLEDSLNKLLEFDFSENHKSFYDLISPEEDKEDRIEDLARSFHHFMLDMGLDMDDASLRDTPKRVAKMFVNETCRGLYDKEPKITTFPNDNKYSGMVVVKDIQVQSLCEHHFQPFVGRCDIAYLPGNKVVGLSKFARVVDHFSRRPQVQERLTQNIYDFLKKVLGTNDIIVRIDSEHFCMKLRGVKDPCSSTATCIAGGRFGVESHTGARQEFFDHLKLSK